VAPFRDPDDPVRCGRCGAGRADRDGIDRRVDLGVGQRLRGHLESVARHRVRAVRQHRHPGQRDPAPGGRLGDQESYLAELSGRLLGIPITLTPGTVVTVLLTLLNSLTPLVPVTMTSVTTDDFLVASDSLQANDLDITSGA
jgi:hypothetical protein